VTGSAADLPDGNRDGPRLRQRRQSVQQHKQMLDRDFADSDVPPDVTTVQQPQLQLQLQPPDSLALQALQQP
jgi:hypothetical protein